MFNPTTEDNMVRTGTVDPGIARLESIIKSQEKMLEMYRDLAEMYRKMVIDERVINDKLKSLNNRADKCRNEVSDMVAAEANEILEAENSRLRGENSILKDFINSFRFNRRMLNDADLNTRDETVKTVKNLCPQAFIENLPENVGIEPIDWDLF